MSTATTIIFCAVLALPPILTCLIGIFLGRRDNRSFQAAMALLRQGLQSGSRHAESET